MEHPESEPLPGTPPESGDEDLARTVDELGWLFRQCWADAVNLLSLEGRVALRSLLLLLALVFCLAGFLAGAWLVLVLFIVYCATTINAPVWAIALGVVLLHLLAFAGLAQQMLALTRLLSFPRSRQAAADLLKPKAAAPEPD